MSGSHIHGGTSTTYLSAGEEERLRRVERDGDAVAYLTRTGNEDVLPVLGLAPSPAPTKRPRLRGGA